MKTKAVRFVLKTIIYQSIILVTLAMTGVACGNTDSSVQKTDNSGAGAGGDDTNNDADVDGIDSEDLGICSTLNFKNVTWSSQLTRDDRIAFALALNISGSFEGHSGWSNISNNFDGQGVSMGLLNQNFGQGSLQPLLLELRDNHMDVLEAAMTDSMRESMLDMLKDWEQATGPIISISQVDDEPQRFPVSERILLSGTGGEDLDAEYGLLARVSGPNKDSVEWAKRTVYKDSKHRVFKDEWAAAFRFITSHPAYVSLQIRAAEYLHRRASDYRDRVNWTQKRAYLFLFDIAVQNGSLRDKHFDKFEKWLNKNPNATEEAQMLEMLEIRVVDSNPKWQKDVRKRKTTVIKGQGFVHGEDRNLPLEYCYDPLTIYPESRQ